MSITSCIGANKEYVSFGGGGPALSDALKTADRSNSMSEGYNAGLPSRLAPVNTIPEQLSQHAPHSPQELISSQEIIKDVDGTQAQKEAAAYLNREEAGEVGLGREVPMQKANLLSPYGRGLRYQAKDQPNAVIPSREGNRAEQFEKSSNWDSKAFEDVHQDLDRIPTEAESDNEPFPEDAMSIANQQNPIEIASAAKQLSHQNTKEQGPKRINHVDDTQLGVVSRFGHTNKDSQEHEQEFRNKEEPQRDGQSQGLFQSKDNKHREEETLRAPLLPQNENHDKTKEEVKYEKGKENAGIQSMAINGKSSHDRNRGPSYYETSRYQNTGTSTGNAVTYGTKFAGNLREPALQKFGAQGLNGRMENELLQTGMGFHRQNSGDIDGQSGTSKNENTDESNLKNHNHIIQNLLINNKEVRGNEASNQERESKFLQQSQSIQDNKAKERLGTKEKNSGTEHDGGEPCKHCDIYPEVTYNLESSHAEVGPLTCKGCGPHPKFTPVIENLGLNMSVSDKLVAPKFPQAKKPITVPLAKDDITDKVPQSKPSGNLESPTHNGDTDNQRIWQQNVQQGYNAFPQKEPRHENEVGHNQGNSHAPYTSQDKGTASDGINSDGANTHSGMHVPPKKSESNEINLSSAQSIQNDEPILQGHKTPYMQSLVQEQAFQKEQSPRHVSSQMSDFEIMNGKGLLGEAGRDKQLLTYTSIGENVPLRAKAESHGSELPNKAVKNFEKESSTRLKKPTVTSRIDTASQGKGESGSPATQDDKTTAAIGTGQNGPKHDKEKEVNEEKPSNLTTLVEIISKGMKALRESNFDIGGKSNQKKESNDIPTNGKDEEKIIKDDNEKKEHGNQKEDSEVKVKPIHTHSGSSSVSGGLPRPESFPAAMKPEEVVSYIHHGGVNNKNTDVGSSIGINEPDGKKVESTGKFDGGGSFSEDLLDNPKHAWHERKCLENPELCKGSGSQGETLGENVMSSKRPTKSSKLSPECATFFNLPERQKRKLPKLKAERLKRNCMPHHQSNIEPLNVPDIKNEDMTLGEKQKTNDALLSAGQKTSALDKINFNVANAKITSLLNQETPEKTAPPGFHPGYTTMAFEHGAVIPEKKLDAMPDTSETFISKAARPDFSSMAGETSGKSSEMAFYFNHKNDQKDKDMLMRALPEANVAASAITNTNNPYGE